MSDHEGSHDHGHPGLEEDSELGYYAMRLIAMEELLVYKGVCAPGEVQRAVDVYDMRSPADGARVVARAWMDPDFKARLLAEPITAIAELGYVAPANMPGLSVLENTEEIHHLVVCTLCSWHQTSTIVMGKASSPPGSD